MRIISQLQLGFEVLLQTDHGVSSVLHTLHDDGKNYHKTHRTLSAYLQLSMGARVL